jgi:hypothetical protein
MAAFFIPDFLERTFFNNLPQTEEEVQQTPLTNIFPVS